MSKLLARTQELLADKSTTDMYKISLATGLSFGWISQVRYKPHMNPSVDKVEKLYEHLSGHPLEVK